MKSADLESAEHDTIVPDEGSSIGSRQPLGASIPRLILDYLGFESAGGDEPRGDRSARATSSRPGSPSRTQSRSRSSLGIPAGEYQFGSILRKGKSPADVETTWPEAHFAPRAVSRSVGRPQVVPPARPDLEAAATVYLKAQARTDGADHAATVSPGDVAAVDPLFQELHRSSPEGAKRLAEGLTSMPSLGDLFLGFRIVEELGRGAFGRVFLAHQGDLAGRLVALKVSAELPGESKTLAQLQHTNIVPIFSAHQALPLHAVCMPYFGRATLADLLEDVEGQPSLPDSGREFLKVVNSRRSGARPGSVAGSAPGQIGPPGSDHDLPVLPITPAAGAEESGSETLQRIGKLSYVDAVLWMGSRIADGLAHAHGRGILHRDLKPANILMTDDGQPMILDFNLSEDLKEGIDASTASAGGTLRYMSPEHLERFLGGAVAVDARSDLFALGVILYELLTGRPPYEIYAGHSIRVLRQMIVDRQVAPPSLRSFNPAVSPAVESIVRHCLEPDRERRYHAASEVHTDLERHLANYPLQHATEPSVAERVCKWTRRHPRVGSTSTVLVVSAVLLVALSSALLVRGRRLAGLEAASDLARFHAEANSICLLIGHRATERADRAEGAARAKTLLARYHVLDDPQWTARPAFLALTTEGRSQLRNDVAEVLLMLAEATKLDAIERPNGPQRVELVRSALRFDELGKANFAQGKEPQAFVVLQATLIGLLGQEDEAARLAAEANKLPLRTARDHYLAAAVLTARGEYAQALPLAEEATRLDPSHFWSYFILGVCHEHLGHDADAMAYFTTGTALRPDFAEAWFYRGMAQLRRVRPDQAIADFDRAAKLRPDWFEPPLNRALVYRDMGDHCRADNDLTHALALGAPAARVYFLRAAERRAEGDRRGADADLAEGLKHEPTDVLGWISRGNARLATHPEAALDDYARALKMNSRSRDAIQYSAYVLSNLPGRNDEVIQMFDRGIAAHPDYATFWASRGVNHAILGHRAESHRDAREALWRDTSPEIRYQVAGIYATTSKTHPEDRTEAYRLLASALRAGYGFDLIETDQELEAIRNQPEFAALIDSARDQARERLPNLYKK